MVQRPGQYKWSSYSMFIGKIPERIINSEIILSYFKHNERDELYKEFIEYKLQPSTLDQIKEKFNISLINVEELLLVMELKRYIKQVGGIFMSIYL